MAVPPFALDETKPQSTDLVSAHPTDERSARDNIESMLSIEHDFVGGRHAFGVGNDALRDAETRWVIGSIWLNTSTSPVTLQRIVSIDPDVWEDVRTTVAANSITATELADNSVGLDELAGGTAGNLITFDASGDPAFVPTGTVDHVLKSGGVGVAPTFQADVFAGQLLHVRDEKASGTDGGTATVGSWETRDLNTVKTNEIVSASLSANRISLPAGTYFTMATAPGFRVGEFQTRLRDVTNSITLVVGSSARSENSNGENDNDSSHIWGRFTLSGTVSLEVQMQVQGTQSGDGFGGGVGFGETEVFADILIWRVT